jgi:gamma-glutamyltranspeptidase/glutathione hydrolase
MHARLLPLFIMSALFSSGQEHRSHARSMVITQEGIVATSHTLASQAGAQVLARGGTAMDAAIAANAVLGVTEPMMNGIGGDLFALYWEKKTGKLHGLNASGWAPKRLTPEFLQLAGSASMPSSGVQSVTVPGAVDGWSKLHKRFGKAPWESLFRAAIHYAERGYPVPEMIQAMWRAGRPTQATPYFEQVFFARGSGPEVGDVFRNPDLARALGLLAAKGSDAFYRGEIARAILTTSERLGGTMSAEDLSEFSSEWVEPISSTYRGWRLYELPPNGQGMAALEILNILETFPAGATPLNSVADLHRKIEATKLAFADLLAYNADPGVSAVPVASLTGKEYGKRRAASIRMDKAACDIAAGEPESRDTVYLAVVDREGNIASLIQSISAAWGSGVAVEGMGFVLHNRGSGFVLEAKHPNVLAGRKRPFHTIIPAFLEKGAVRIGFGIMGGQNQPLAHAQFVVNLADHGMNLQAALEAPRFTKRRFTGCEVALESRIPETVVEGLRSLGHEVSVYGDYSFYMGRGQAVLHNAATGVNYGASDPRGDGSAEPEPLP